MSKVRVIKQLFFSVLIIVLVGGCASDNQYQPIINVEMSPEIAKYKGKAAQVDRRLILTTHKKDEKLPSICAEPFPEGVSALETLSKYNLAVRGQTGGKEDSFKFDTSIPFSIHPAVKFYRDGVFALCQGAMNDWVDTNPKETEACSGTNKTAITNQTPGLQYRTFDVDPELENVTPELEIAIRKLEIEKQKLEIEKQTQEATIRDQLCNQKPYISEFEYQLNELRNAVVRIFEAEARIREASKKGCQPQVEMSGC